MGGKRAWIAALLIFVIGSVLCAVSWNDTSLIAMISLPLPLGPILGPVLGGLLVATVFAWWALRRGARKPIVNIALLSVRSLGSASAVLFTAGAAMYAGIFLLPLYYQQLRGESVLAAALLLIPQGVGSLVSRFVVGKLVGRFGASAITIATFLLTAVATVPFAFVHGAVGAFHIAFWWVFGITVVAFLPALALPAARPAQPIAAARPAQPIPVAEAADNG